MSSQFWLKLCLSLCFLLCAVIFINRTKIQFIRKLLASHLRHKILPRMKAILSIIGEGYAEQEQAKFSLFKLKADLEVYVPKSDVLFDVEKDTLLEFLTKLSRHISMTDNQAVTPALTEELMLCGQRLINEINELKD